MIISHIIIDNLTYYYGDRTTASNKLLYVTDNTVDAIDRLEGFRDGNTSGNDYAYDVNGNMLIDKNKGIASIITYNFLNLPVKLLKSTASLTYIYDATGRKLSQLASFGAGSNKLTEYVGPWVFENNEVQFLQHDEGRITLTSPENILQSECDFVDGLTATSGVTLTSEAVNGETFVKVTGASGASLSKKGIELSTIFDVTAGDRYVFNVRGYRNSANVHLYIRGIVQI